MEDIFVSGNHGGNEGGRTGDVYITPRGNGHGHEPQPPKKKAQGSGHDRQPQPPKKKKKKKSSIGKKLVSILLIVAILFGSAFAYAYSVISAVNYNEEGHAKNQYVNESELLSSLSVKNILFIGVDRRAVNESSRSDTMLLFSIDQKNREIKLTSFMRDTWVYIPGKDTYAKLNAACKYGGAQLVMDTIEYNFNIRIDHYILVDFEIFSDIVDSLGGVDVEITEKEAKYMRDRVHLTDVVAGASEHLNGREALWYCRIRELDSDFMRTKRQRKVIEAIVGKVRSTNPFKLTSIAKEVIADVETDMSPLNLSSLAVNGVLRYMRYDVSQANIPGEGTWKNATKSGQAVLVADLDENRRMLKEFLYG